MLEYFVVKIYIPHPPNSLLHLNSCDQLHESAAV